MPTLEQMAVSSPSAVSLEEMAVRLPHKKRAEKRGLLGTAGVWGAKGAEALGRGIEQTVMAGVGGGLRLAHGLTAAVTGERVKPRLTDVTMRPPPARVPAPMEGMWPSERRVQIPLQESIQRTAQTSIPEQQITGLTKFALGLAATKKVPLPILSPVSKMALQMATVAGNLAYGEGKPAPEIVNDTISGGLMGYGMEAGGAAMIARNLHPKLAMALSGYLTGTPIATVEAMQLGGASFPEALKQAQVSGGVMAGLGLLFGGKKPKPLPPRAGEVPPTLPVQPFGPTYPRRAPVWQQAEAMGQPAPEPAAPPRRGSYQQGKGPTLLELQKIWERTKPKKGEAVLATPKPVQPTVVEAPPTEPTLPPSAAQVETKLARVPQPTPQAEAPTERVASADLPVDEAIVKGEEAVRRAEATGNATNIARASLILRSLRNAKLAGEKMVRVSMREPEAPRRESPQERRAALEALGYELPPSAAQVEGKGAEVGRKPAKALIGASVREFGLTENVREAGYILPDGRLLDFSGRREGAFGGGRQMDHRDVSRLWPEGIGGTDAMLRFEAEVGAVRLGVVEDDLHLGFSRPPTEAQSQLIREATVPGSDVRIDITEPTTGRDLASLTVTNASKAKVNAALGRVRQSLSAKVEKLAEPAQVLPEPLGAESTLKAKVRESATKRLAKGEKGAILGPDEWADLVNLGKAKFQRGVTTFSAWAKEMVVDAGAWVKQHLQRLWAQVRKPMSPAQMPKVASTPDEATVKLQRMIRASPAAVARKSVLVSAEKGQRVARGWAAAKAVEQRGGTYQERLLAARGALKGEYPEGKLPLWQEVGSKFTQPETDLLYKKIWETNAFAPARKFFGTQIAERGLTKTLTGELPVTSELEAMERVFGKSLVATILRKRPFGERAWENTVDALNLPRAVLAAYDISAPLRQGALLIGEKEWWLSWKPMLKALAKEDNLLTLDNKIKNDPMYDLLVNRAGRKLYQAPVERLGELTAREESAMSKIAEKIPGIRASNRAYIAFLNNLRFYTAKKWVRALGKQATERDVDAIVHTVNVLSGRGSLGSWEPHGAHLATVLFSPRFIASRFQSVLAAVGPTMPLAGRKIALKNFAAFLAAQAGLLGFASLMGAEVETDRRSPDWGKIRVGNRRFDIWAGYQPLVRYTTQVMMGEAKDPDTKTIQEIDRLARAYRFGESKASPAAGLLLDTLRGKSFVGAEIEWTPSSIKRQLRDRFLPMGGHDAVQAMLEEFSATSAAMAAGGMIGGSLQVWEPRKKKSTWPKAYKRSTGWPKAYR